MLRVRTSKRRRCLRCDSYSARDGTYFDDATRTAGKHSWQRSLDAAQRAEVVGLHGASEDIERRLLDCTGSCAARVVHEHVEASMLGKRLLKEFGSKCR